jgi:hypothetical protein
MNKNREFSKRSVLKGAGEKLREMILHKNTNQIGHSGAYL